MTAQGVLILQRQPEMRQCLWQTLHGMKLSGPLLACETPRACFDALLTGRFGLLILDLDAPGPSGLNTLIAVKSLHPDLPVLVCSAEVFSGGSMSIEVLLNGASDYLPLDPLLQTDPAQQMAAWRVLLQKWLPSAQPPATPPRSALAAPSAGALRAVVMAASTGGPRILALILSALPAALPVPVLIVQHMPADFQQDLVQSLQHKTALPLQLAQQGAALAPGQIWLAPAGYHLSLRAEADAVWLNLDQEKPLNGCRPSADRLFVSAAAIYGQGLLGLVLTGMGSDGLAGARAIRAAGGEVWIQNAPSAAVWGMPGAVAQEGLATREMAPEGLAQALRQRLLQAINRPEKLLE